MIFGQGPPTRAIQQAAYDVCTVFSATFELPYHLASYSALNWVGVLGPLEVFMHRYP